MSKFTEDEPVLTATAATAAVSYVMSLLVTHGVLTATAASALTQQVVPAVAAVLTVAVGFVIRRLVTPAKKVKYLLESQGLMTDADFGRLDAIVADVLLRHLNPMAAPTPAAMDPGIPAAAGHPQG